MAKVRSRDALYDKDYLAWTESQVLLLRSGRTNELDVENIAEELEDMGRSEWRELENRLEVLLMHMLKWDYQPRRRSRSWQGTIVEQRNAITRLLRRSPSLRRNLAATVRAVYPDAVRRAVAETGLPISAFPLAMPYMLDEVLGADAAPKRRRSSSGPT